MFYSGIARGDYLIQTVNLISHCLSVAEEEEPMNMESMGERKQHWGFAIKRLTT